MYACVKVAHTKHSPPEDKDLTCMCMYVCMHACIFTCRAAASCAFAAFTPCLFMYIHMHMCVCLYVCTYHYLPCRGIMCLCGVLLPLRRRRLTICRGQKPDSTHPAVRHTCAEKFIDVCKVGTVEYATCRE
jgi:hypothetical protein